MTDVLKIASYICQRYKEQFGNCIDEMKLHKLLYFCQRESIVQTGEPLFAEKFKAWRYGPVLVDIRQKYRDGSIHTMSLSDDLKQYDAVFDKIFQTYASKDSWSLSAITHGEYSWQKARIGYAPDAQCDVAIETDDIRKDAERIKVRRLLINRISTLKEASHEDNR